MNHTINTYGVLSLIIALVFILFGATAVFAEEHETRTIRADAQTTNDVDVQVRPDGTTTNVRTNVETSFRADADAMRTRIEEKRALLQEEVQERREAVRQNIEVLQNRRETNVRAGADVEVQERRMEIRAKIESRHDAFAKRQEQQQRLQEERRAEIMERVATKAAARIELHLDRFYRILGTAIERMYGLAERIQARADILAEAGVDTAVAQEYLDLAMSELAATESDLITIDADLEATLSIDTESLTREKLKEIFTQTREAIRSAQERIRATHQALRSAFVELKTAAELSADVNTESDDTEDDANDNS